MNAVASILVHVDALPRSRMRLELVRTLAQRLDATVQCWRRPKTEPLLMVVPTEN